MKSMIWILALILMAYLLMGCKSDITPKEAKKLVKEGAFLLDVRTRGEFKNGHITKAVNIPVSELMSRLKELPDKKKTIVVYCRSGRRSGRAQKMLKAKGYASVHNLGARSNWK